MLSMNGQLTLERDFLQDNFRPTGHPVPPDLIRKMSDLSVPSAKESEHLYGVTPFSASMYNVLQWLSYQKLSI